MTDRRWFFAVLTVLILIGITVFREVKEIRPVQEVAESDTSAFADWKDFKSDEGGFGVKLPTLPQNAKEIYHDKNTQEKRLYNIFVSEKPDGTIFTVIIIKYPDGKITQAPSTLVQGVVDEMMKSNPKNRVVDMDKVKFEGQDALKFDIINEQAQINGLAFSKGNNLYILSYTAHVDKHHPSEYDHFIKSFKLK